MAKKMYYTEEETLAKLSVSKEQIQELVKQQKLHAYIDGGRKMYKAEEVDAIGGKADTGEIELMPASSDATDAVSLSAADAKPSGGTKEDTVVTAEGVSIFDDEDLEIETADPMAKTHVAPAAEDQVLIEGVGSGSGLLDLTRESDDTSLGPVLDHIEMEDAVGSDISVGSTAVTPAVPGAAETAVSVQPVFVEAVDASGGLFAGVAAACVVMSLLMLAMTVAQIAQVVPGFFEKLKENIVIVIVGGVALAAAFGVVGMLAGKSMAARQEALRRLSA